MDFEDMNLINSYSMEQVNKLKWNKIKVQLAFLLKPKLIPIIEKYQIKIM